MNGIWKVILSMSLSGTLLITALLLFKPMFRNRFGRRWQYYIWLVVISRLLLPFTPQESLMNTLFLKAGQAGIQTGTALVEEQMTGLMLAGGAIGGGAAGNDSTDGGTLWNDIVENRADGNGAADKSVVDKGAVNKGAADKGAVDKGAVDKGVTGSENETSKSSTGLSPAVLTAGKLLSHLSQNLWLIWLMTAIILLTRKITAYQDFRDYVKASGEAVADTRILDRMAVIGGQAGIRKPVELYINPLVSSPLLMGLFHPCIVLPEADMQETGFDCILLHELTHLRRMDTVYKWLVQFTICLHWFNPLVHLMGREISRACELACDEAVIMKLNREKIRVYGDTLIHATGAGGICKAPLSSVTLIEGKELLKERLGAIMTFKKKTRFAAVTAFAMTLLLSAGAITTGAYAASHASISGSQSISDLREFLNRSLYHNFHAATTEDEKNYEISGTIYQNIHPRSLVRFEKLPDTGLTVSGSITPLDGEIRLMYRDEDGTLVTLADETAGAGEAVPVSCSINVSEKGEFYFESDSAICEFDLLFSKSDGTVYYLTNENPIGLTY
ncbi:hypothetical protein DXC92_21530 [Clostridiales bacterium TF09-2AC]|nr:hypothetical protein DXC92_21530 [Clostridiales bacterium TF09-2AC]